MHIFGIDPGYSGAIVALRVNPRAEIVIAGVLDCPVNGTKSGKSVDGSTVAKFLEEFLLKEKRVHLFIEGVTARPHDGPARAFAFGKGFGVHLGVVAGLAIPHTIVGLNWKRKMGLTADKNSSRQRATQLWPDARDPEKQERGLFARVMDDGRAEAALIAEYGRQLRNITD